MDSSVAPEGTTDYEFAIEGRKVGCRHPCLIIGEVAQGHDGSLGLAHAFIDAIADAGADAVKFQTHIASAESTVREALRVPLTSQDASRFDYWRRTEFAPEQWLALARHAKARGLIFLSSPFSIEAIRLLRDCGVQAWKIGSGEVCHQQLIEEAARRAEPVLLSTGMCAWGELTRAVSWVRSFGAPLALLQCTSRYPTPAEQVGVQFIPVLRDSFGCVTGLSDHSGTIYPSVISAFMGASIIEVHVTLTREMFGPDVAASVTTAELRELIAGVRFAERMQTEVPSKDVLADALTPVRRMFFRSVVARHALAAGSTLTADDLVLKKPGDGIPPDQLEAVVGRVLLRNLADGAQVCLEDLAPNTQSVTTY